MDPATFYMLTTVAGAERLTTLHFPTMQACETFSARAFATPPPSDTEVLQHVCWPQGKWPPDWVSNRPTVGVPVMPQDLLR